MPRSMQIVFAFAGLSLLAACGARQPERSTGGALAGAGTGAVIGAIGGPVGIAAGAAIGAAAGAGTGAVTTPRQLNLDKPVTVGGYRP
ncbi:MAG: hypothetical protein ABI369_12515 [Acetobacteraceae bacterium]